jgi:hypothetical protein
MSDRADRWPASFIAEGGSGLKQPRQFNLQSFSNRF